ncbi:MAG TPA: SDR family oxidoreductase [Candidatus Dormibacteraeota bacterium]|nr:SDR family oxidoreductase [Candidatus Dormibacteraeota bacterium]
MSGGRLEGRVAIVTGGTMGIGAAVTRSFLAEGASLVIVARRPPAPEIRKELGPNRVRFLEADVAEEATAARAVDLAQESYGGLDILVNNAALDFVRDIDETATEDARRVLEVNFLGAFWMLRLAGRVMRERGRGSIVNVVSRYALVGGAGMGIYSAAKGALLSLTRSAAVEWGPAGVRVNAVAPGLTDTPLIRTWIAEQPDPERFRAQLTASLPLRRLGEAEDVASAVLYLASDEARQVTGACLSVDGGFTAG